LAASIPATGGGAPLLVARGLTKRYGRFEAVRGVDLVLPVNGFVTILGPSGCGKTTILRMIGGFETVSEGTLELDGRSLKELPASRRPVNTVFQSYALFPHLTVLENVAFGLRVHGLDAGSVRQRAMAALATVRMAELAGRYPSQISGGQQQRVAVARAFVNEPRLLLLDEPLGALDLKMRRHLQVELKDLQRRLGTTFLYVTHDQEEAFALSDEVIVMNGGRIEQQGSPEEIYHCPRNAFVADFIDGANLLPGRLLALAADGGTIETAFGRFSAPTAPGLAVGDPVSLCFRPEQVRLGEAAMACAVRLRGQVAHVVFQGASQRVELDLGGARIAAQADHALPVQPGAMVELGLAPASLWIVAGHKPEGAA
jgi:spermidine/putrescine transport system ATP-binding protein